MIDITIEVDTKEIDAQLKSLPEKLAARVLRQGVFSGAKLIRDRVKRAAPIRREGKRGKYYGKWGAQLIRYPGYLKRMIGAKYNARQSNKWQATYNVKPMGPGYYGYFVEGGHAIVRGNKERNRRQRELRRGLRFGSSFKMVPAHPFMEPVFRNAANEAIARMKTVISQGVLREWAMTGFKGFGARP